MTSRSAEETSTACSWLTRFSEETGATTTEYGVVLTFIVILTISSITFLGLELQGWFDDLTAHLKLLLGIP